MVFELPKLEYKYDALEPYIDAKTMEIHYSKHHAGYVDKLNAVLNGYAELKEKSINELLQDVDSLHEDLQKIVINNGGGHANHSLFWEIMSAEGGKPSGKLDRAIEKELGGIDKFKKDFSN